MLFDGAVAQKICEHGRVGAFPHPQSFIPSLQTKQHGLQIARSHRLSVEALRHGSRCAQEERAWARARMVEDLDKKDSGRVLPVSRSISTCRSIVRSELPPFSKKSSSMESASTFRSFVHIFNNSACRRSSEGGALPEVISG